MLLNIEVRMPSRQCVQIFPVAVYTQKWNFWFLISMEPSYILNFKCPLKFMCFTFVSPIPPLLIGRGGVVELFRDRYRLQGSALWRLYAPCWLKLLSVSCSSIMATASTSDSWCQAPHLILCDRLKSSGILSQRHLSGILSNEHKSN